MCELDPILLPVLDALLCERHLTRAARGFRLSQSAASHAPQSLRRALGDHLFVRAPSGLIPTERRLAVASADGAVALFSLA